MLNMFPHGQLAQGRPAVLAVSSKVKPLEESLFEDPLVVGTTLAILPALQASVAVKVSMTLYSMISLSNVH